MESLRKTITVAIILCGLISLSSGFCAHAAVQDEGMVGMAMHGVAAHTLSVDTMIAQGRQVEVVSQTDSHSVDSCLFDCVSKVPQATVAQKMPLSHQIADLTSDVSDTGMLSMRMLSGRVAIEGSPGGPSSAENLLAVQKLE